MMTAHATNLRFIKTASFERSRVLCTTPTPLCRIVWFCCMMILSMAMVEVDGQLYEGAWITSSTTTSNPLKFISICLAAPECTVEHSLSEAATRRNASTLTEALTFTSHSDVLFLNGLPELGIDRCGKRNCPAAAAVYTGSWFLRSFRGGCPPHTRRVLHFIEGPGITLEVQDGYEIDPDSDPVCNVTGRIATCATTPATLTYTSSSVIRRCNGSTISELECPPLIIGRTVGACPLVRCNRRLEVGSWEYERTSERVGPLGESILGRQPGGGGLPDGLGGGRRLVGGDDHSSKSVWQHIERCLVMIVVLLLPLFGYVAGSRNKSHTI